MGLSEVPSIITRRDGKCTKCGAQKASDWAGCPLDGFCPAPDYTRRKAQAQPNKATPS